LTPIGARAATPGGKTRNAGARTVPIGSNELEERNMKVRPIHDRLLVKRIEEDEKSKGGIIIPDTAKEKPMQGKVVAAGPGKVNEDGKVTPLDVKKGDKVLFSKYAGSEIQLDGDEHLIIREDDVLAVLK
jgi:chaperonin GroES